VSNNYDDKVGMTLNGFWEGDADDNDGWGDIFNNGGVGGKDSDDTDDIEHDDNDQWGKGDGSVEMLSQARKKSGEDNSREDANDDYDNFGRD
jgi:hypothetical protein